MKMYERGPASSKTFVNAPFLLIYGNFKVLLQKMVFWGLFGPKMGISDLERVRSL